MPAPQVVWSVCIGVLIMMGHFSLAWSAEGRSGPPAVFVWIDVADVGDRYPLLADGSKGIGHRDALMVAARERGLDIRLARTSDTYQLGHVATETSDAYASLRRMARGDALLVGTLSLRPDGHWDFDWLMEDHGSAVANAPPGARHQVKGVILKVGLQAGIELAADALGVR
jgi:hypothetical protein